jgi:hypothetical protein
MPVKHSLPSFLNGVVTPQTCERWLARRAVAHVRGDRKRGYSAPTPSHYKEAIHEAVLKSKGRDAYTGEALDWRLISTYKNEDSKGGRRTYKAGFALLPRVDHVDARTTETSFIICAWRTNDAKNDLSLASFIGVCKTILRHAGYTVTRRG